MFADYRAQVLEDYRKKKDRNELSLNLTLPTPAKLRNECLAVLSARYSAKDEKTLKLFFGARDHAADYEQAIRKIDIDKFRPLNKLLSNNEIRTDEKNIELLAWLIDFQPRPYRLAFNKPDEEVISAGAAIDKEKLFEDTEKKPSAEETVSLIPSVKGSTTGASPQGRKLLISKKKGSLILLIILALTGARTYPVLTSFLAPQECMYWTGEEYKPISCNEKAGDTPILALDAVKVSNFKKITLTDTITRQSLGHVWYSKIDNRLEFFTSDGMHPTNDDRRLKPVTKYIIDKYLLENREASER